MLLGYARLSKGEEQATDAQVATLKDAGASRILEETASGGVLGSPGTSPAA